MECHFFLDKALFDFSMVFLKRKIAAPFYYIQENFTFGKLTGEFKYDEKNAHLKFPLSSCHTKKIRRLSRFIDSCVNKECDIILWTNSRELNQECLQLEVLSLLNGNKIKIIDLARSRRELATESTHDYYYSLYLGSHFIEDHDRIKFFNLKEELERQGGEIRIKHKGSLNNVPFQYFDHQILACTSDTPKKAFDILVEVIPMIYGEDYILPGDFLILHRLYFLSNTGQLAFCVNKLSPKKLSCASFKHMS
ncbi:DUF3658 domain-containing protein [Pantoea ananatis]|uniref:DUF3658 domain-containing protein n=1 Tax=Pantoea ananas TaxID=553 RepID=UPI003FA47B2B